VFDLDRSQISSMHFQSSWNTPLCMIGGAGGAPDERGGPAAGGAGAAHRPAQRAGLYGQCHANDLVMCGLVRPLLGRASSFPCLLMCFVAGAQVHTLTAEPRRVCLVQMLECGAHAVTICQRAWDQRAAMWSRNGLPLQLSIVWKQEG